MSKCLAVLLLLINLPVLAMQETSQRPEFAVGTMLGSLILVLACIFIFAFLMKKTNLLKHNGYQQNIKVLATQPLSNKSRVQIIEVYGKQYLLGVTDQSVNLLKELPEMTEQEQQTQAPQATLFANAFASVLSKTGKKQDV